jgi:c-di-GMP-binding flagellar brake protein YcgR
VGRKNTKSGPEALGPLLSDEDDVGRYTLDSATTIDNELRLLVQRRDMITVVFGPSQNSFLSLIIDIDAKARVFRFDNSIDTALNDAVERSGRLVFTAMPLGVRIQFNIPGRIKTVAHRDGQPAFQGDFPTSIFKLQRRDHLRVRQLNPKPLLCTLLHPNGTVITMKLHDISLGGVGMLIRGGLAVDPMDVFADCRIDLGNSGVLEVAMTVLYKRQVANFDGIVHTFVGARFIDLGRDAENLVRHYIGQVERELQRLRRRL